MVVTYYIKHFRPKADRHNGILMSLLLLVAETIKLLETENKILKNNIGTKQKLTDSLLQYNNLLITQQERLTTELLTTTSENCCKGRSKDAVQTENNIRH